MQRDEIKLAGDTIELIKKEMKIAVTEAVDGLIRKHATPETARAIFLILMEVVMEQSQLAGGRLLWSGVKKFFSSVWTYALLLVLAWVIGGPALFAAAFALLGGQK